ncbi:MAG: DNA integrity scanning protein DisA [Candidatus Pacearchaeota archaeon]|nr:MAG: DNA integrity scanning protein DisA [Candidatus Pacearchaeota archaeon]
MNTQEKEEIKKEAEREAERERRERDLDELFEIVKLVRPGTKLRTAIDDMVKASMGSLIVVGDSQEVLKTTNGGFKIDCKFTPQKLVELSKMDGAIILSDDLKKIVYCNTLLVPDHNIETHETGTRHKAAERTAKQTSRPVIAVSERRKTINLYYKNTKYALRNTERVLSKTVETLRMLEKHREILNELLVNLNVLEFANFESLRDIISCIQKMEIISRIAETIKKYLIELGNEGNLVEILLKEVIKGVDKEKNLLLMDYSRNWEFTKTALATLNFNEVLESENIIRVLLYSSPSDPVMPIGYRLLSKVSVSQESKDTLIGYFKNFPSILNTIETEPDKITRVIGEKDANKLIKELKKLKEQVLVGKRI